MNMDVEEIHTVGASVECDSLQCMCRAALGAKLAAVKALVNSSSASLAAFGPLAPDRMQKRLAHGKTGPAELSQKMKR